VDRSDKELDHRTGNSSDRASPSSNHGLAGQLEESRLSEPEIDIKEVIGRNLKLAREAAELSQEVFAERLGLSRATLSGFENGKVAIDSAKLLKAAQILGAAVADFFKEDEQQLALLYRAAEDTIPNSAVRSRFRHHCEAYRDLEEIVGVADSILPAPEYKYQPMFHSKPFHFAAQVAQSERERLGLGQLDPIANVFRLLDENGVRVFSDEIEQDGVFGLSGFSNRYGPCILVNLRKHTLERNIFTLVHEYAHLLMHRDYYVNPAPPEKKDPEMEEVANCFAAHFLIPEAALRDSLNKTAGQKSIGLEDVIFLKHHFKVSAQAMLRRLRDCGLMGSNDHDELLAKVKRSAGDGTKEFAPLQVDLIGAWRQVCRFQFLARKAALGGMVSVGKLSELLGQNLVQTRNEIQSWRKEIASGPA
jgi:Zn-dependent peptidase ImmA (M78 family)/transcriptional regulator with XRE-family HTH domain